MMLSLGRECHADYISWNTRLKPWASVSREQPNSAAISDKVD